MKTLLLRATARRPCMALALLVVAGCGRSPTSAPPRARRDAPSPPPAAQQQASRVAAPAWTLPDLEGASHRLEDYRGRIVLLNFWATWCPPCREELPELAHLQQAYASRGVTVVGIAMESGSTRAIRSFAEGMGMTYPVVLGDIDVAQAYRVMGIPASFLVDREGRAVKRWNGPYPYEAFARSIDALLAEEPGPETH